MSNESTSADKGQTDPQTIDTLETICQKYKVNLSGFINVLAYAVRDLKQKNYNVPDPEMVMFGGQMLLQRDPKTMSVSFVKDVFEHDCFSHILTKDAEFFNTHASELIGQNLPDELKKVCNMIFQARTPEGRIAFTDSVVVKLMDYFLAFTKLGLKSVLAQSDIVSMEYHPVEGYTIYNTKSDVIPNLPLSKLIHQFQVKGIPQLPPK